MATKGTFKECAVCVSQEADPPCFQASREGGAALAHARTHEVCALAASLALRGSMDREDILSACLGVPLKLPRLLSLEHRPSDRILDLFLLLNTLNASRFSISWDLMVVLCLSLPMLIVQVRPHLG